MHCISNLHVKYSLYHIINVMKQFTIHCISTYDPRYHCIHGWSCWFLGCFARFYDLLLVNYTQHSLLTAADVRCTATSTRKMENWMMCCMVSEGSHCSSEVQYTLNQPVGNININTHRVLLPVLLRIWFSGLFLSLCAVGVSQRLQVCLLVQTGSIWSAT